MSSILVTLALAALGANAAQAQPFGGDCVGETLCVSGAVPGRSEVFVRIVGPKPNGYVWPNVVKFTTSQVEVWIEQLGSGVVKYYLLPGPWPNLDDLPGLYDRLGFLP